MKTIKIILGVITFLVVAFLLTGLFIKETNYQTMVTVNKPISEVFLAFTKTENIKEWIPEIKSVTVINENPGKIGSVYEIVLNNNGQEITMREKVMAFVNNEKITLFFDAENMLKTDEYHFVEKEGTTSIQLNAVCISDSYIMACMFPYFKRTFQAQDLGYLNSFKAFVEK